MKKLISIICTAAMLTVTLSAGFTAYADVLEEKAIDNFIENSCEIIREYDADKDFISEEEAISAYNSEKNENFQTCRLIVEADGAFDDFGAIEHIKGFEGFHILQYKSESDAEIAYNSLLTEKNILSVNIDKTVSPLQSEEAEDTATDVFPESTNGHLCDWSTERTQSAPVNEYIKKNNIPLTDITVGVVDTGVDYNHEFLQSRIVRTYFNSSPDGNENDELDVLDGHGTAVSSVVVDNTPESVSLAVYRVLDDEADNTVSGICAGILQAVADDVNIINISMAYWDENDLTKSAVSYADEKGVPIVCCAGNAGWDIELCHYSPADINSTISVAAVSKKNRICYWSNSGLNVDLSAPGEEVNVAVPNNRYDVWDGTSFSSPCVVAAIATIKSVCFDYSYDKIENMLKETAIPLKVYSDNSMLNVDNFKLIDEPYNLYGEGLIQVASALGLESIQSPEVNYKSGNYSDEIIVEIESDYPVYYTLDGTYPTTKSELYSEPLTINEDTDLRAIAYDENSLSKFSSETEFEYQIFQTGTDDMFEIDENGCITAYSGNISNLSVPDIINGTEVKAFDREIFNDGIVTKLILPDTISEIPSGAFVNNDIIQYINTGGASVIAQSAFSYNTGLYTIDMPNVEGIGTEAFSRCAGMYDAGFLINAPKLKYIQKNGFYICSFFNINAPKLETLYSSSFYKSNIKTAGFPSLKAVEKSGVITRSPFYDCSVMILDMPNLESCASGTLLYNCNQVQYINLPRFNGNLSSSSSYEFLTYCNVTKETALLSGLDYYDVDVLGGSIRVTDAGLRFGFSFFDTQGKSVEEYGFIYAGGEKDGNDLIIENAGNGSVYKLTAKNRITHEDGTTTFNLVFIDIPKASYGSRVSARAYVKIDGSYYYSDTLCYSFNDIADAVLADEEVDEGTKSAVRSILNNA